jgi:hypothetical protein
MAKKKSFEERRKKPRAPFRAEAVVAMDGESIHVTTMEISVGGLTVAGPHACKKGAQASVKFLLPESEEPIKQAVSVVGVRFTEQGHIWRLRFDNPNYRIIGEIERFVRMHLVSQAREKYQSKPPPKPVRRKRKGKGKSGGLSGLIKKVFKRD